MASRRLVVSVAALSTAATRGGRRRPPRAPPPAAASRVELAAAAMATTTTATATTAAAAAAATPTAAAASGGLASASTTTAAVSPPVPPPVTDAADAADGGGGVSPPPRLATPDGWTASAFTDTATATLEAVADALAETGLESLPGWDVELASGVLRIEVGVQPPQAVDAGSDGSSVGSVSDGGGGGEKGEGDYPVATPAVPTGGVYVLNLQTPNRQIWVSSPISGPARYGWAVDGGGWYACRGGGGLWALLVSELGGGLAVPPGEV
ncbi:hypothetical protein MMPV_006612 [Pyropia vietnamensis]